MVFIATGIVLYKKPINLGIRQTYADIAKTVDEMFGVYSDKIEGTSFLNEILKNNYKTE